MYVALRDLLMERNNQLGQKERSTRIARRVNSSALRFPLPTLVWAAEGELKSRMEGSESHRATCDDVKLGRSSLTAGSFEAKNGKNSNRNIEIRPEKQ